MVLDSLGLSLPWNWSNTNTASGSKVSLHDRKKPKKRSSIRTRAEQIASNGGESPEDHEVASDEGYYPGLVNISGTYCFMNSTLQAMASLSYLQPHIDSIHAKAEALDVPSHVIDALQELFQILNTPRSSYHAIRPIKMIDVLTNHTNGRHNSLLCSREHQDAQELFQLLSECVKQETADVDKEAYRDRGLGGLAQIGETNREIGKGVFDGLTANRRSCVECGYTEAVMHFAFDNWQLAVPRSVSCQLEDCLADYTRLELLTDCICRKCSMLATHRRLVHEVEKLTDAIKSDPNPSSSKKKRARDARKMEARVKAALDEGRIEDDIKDLKMEKVFSKASTKQAMIARPPPILALHLNRSVHYGQYASKNTVRVIFPEILDLTPFTTSGNLSTVPSIPISTPPPSLPRSTTPTPATYSTPRTIYRLSAVVCHYGGHSFGHYICYRRKPRPISAGAARFAPPHLADPLFGFAAQEEGVALVWEDEPPSRPGKGWLRVSDDAVREVGIETVLQEGSGAFMMYYERVEQPRPGVYPYPSRSSPRSSEETLKPEMGSLANGSATSLVSVKEGAVLEIKQVEEKIPVVGLGKSPLIGPRIIRSVATGRGRSFSATPSERGSSVTPSETTSKPTESPVPNGVLHNNESDSGGVKSPTPSATVDSPSKESKQSVHKPQPRTSPSVASSISTSSAHHPPLTPRIHSPQPYPPSPSPIVGLKA